MFGRHTLRKAKVSAKKRRQKAGKRRFLDSFTGGEECREDHHAIAVFSVLRPRAGLSDVRRTNTGA